MRKVTLILLTLIFTTSVIGQITKTKIAKKKEVISDVPYDSLHNFLAKDVHLYIGQELYLKERPESLRKYGYDNFVLDYQYKGYDRKSNTYKCCDSYNSKYDELKGKFFRVIDIHKHPKADENSIVYGDKYYLELEEKVSKDKVYFEYSTKFESSFPFLVVGFYEKQKSLWVGQDFVFTDRILKVSSGGGIDITTGESLMIKTGEVWKCIDLTIEEKYYSLALLVENERGNTTTVSYDSTFDDRHFAYTAKEANQYKNKIGTEKFNLILQGKVKIGMTKEMCELSWGEPKDINNTITSGRKSEQWVYEDNYLYFDNGILTTIQ
jgi:hypothetical protein